jgi:cytochrome P450 family 307 subfamily A
MEGIFLSSASYLLLAALALVLLALVADWCRKNKDTNDNKAPGPKPWPIIGSLHLLGGYEIPYQAFDNLANKYGPIFSITLGEVPCLVVSGLDLVKEILLVKGDHFDGRPNFRRFQLLFNGDKENCKYPFLPY